MYLLLGNLRMEAGDYKDAIQLFERACAQTRPHASQALSVVSLVSFLMAISHRIDHLAIFGRYLDGTLTILTSRFDNVFVKPCMPPVASGRQASLYWIWQVLSTKTPIGPGLSLPGFRVSYVTLFL